MCTQLYMKLFNCKFRKHVTEIIQHRPDPHICGLTSTSFISCNNSSPLNTLMSKSSEPTTNWNIYTDIILWIFSLFEQCVSRKLMFRNLLSLWSPRKDLYNSPEVELFPNNAIPWVQGVCISPRTLFTWYTMLKQGGNPQYTCNSIEYHTTTWI